MKKKTIKMIVFMLIFCIILYYIIKLLWYPASSITYFYDEPKNSLDIVYMGSSNAYEHFNTVLAYDLYGYTTGLLSADLQPFVLSKYLIKESEKYQHPSLYIIDLAIATKTIDTFDDYGLRRTIDSMKFSRNRIDAINELLSYRRDISKEEYMNYYFSFLFYHNKWKDISRANITGEKQYYKGFLFRRDTASVKPIKTYNWTEDVLELQEENKQILNDLINYIKLNDLNVLFVVPPRIYEKENNARLNNVIKIIQENGLEVVNFNTLEEFKNIDFSTDFYHEVHLNVYGATKYTLYFSKYLKENYKLVNHKEDNSYNSWNEEYEEFKQSFRKITNKEFDEVLLEYKNDYKS